MGAVPPIYLYTVDPITEKIFKMEDNDLWLAYAYRYKAKVAAGRILAPLCVYATWGELLCAKILFVAHWRLNRKWTVITMMFSPQTCLLTQTICQTAMTRTNNDHKTR
jgi:hypothetical protein